MRIACVYLPHFYVQVEKLKAPELEGRQVIIGGAPEERKNVVDCSEEASALGIHPGMTLREAYHLCPDALFLPFGGSYGHVWEDILFALSAFTLRIEPESPGLAYLDITRAVKIFKDERTMALAIVRDMLESSSLPARIGVGNSRFIARQAARCAWDALVVEPGEEKDFLSFLPTDALPIEEKEKEHLHLLGLFSLKNMACLSRKALVSQFGRGGGNLWDTVNGMDDRRPIPRRKSAICLEREFTSEAPLETWGEFATAMSPLVEQLVDELARTGMACRKIELTLLLQNRRSLDKLYVMKKPATEANTILRLITDSLERFVVGSPIMSFRISLPDPVSHNRDQDGLFRTKSVFAERLDGIKSFFNARYGYVPIMRVEEGEAQSRLPERRFRFTNV